MKTGKGKIEGVGFWVKAAVLAAVCAGALGAEANPEKRKRVRYADTPEKRLGLIAPVKEGELRLRPTFVSCGVCWGSAREIAGLALRCRPAGGAWKTAPHLPYFAESKDYRASVLDLEEDTAYEVELTGPDGAALARGTFRTWKSEVPVARTVTVDPKTAKFPIRISEKGTDAGWIRYTLPAGTTLDNRSGEFTFVVDGASHVLFDDMRVKGGPARYVFEVTNTDHIRIRNCELTDWGRDGEVDFKKLARRTHNGKPINFDGAIYVGTGVSHCVIERCYVHDPISHSCSWYYSHPAGNEAVIFAKPDHSCVVRWCDFVGSDPKRYNDAVESAGNFHEDGGFNRDADVYGNFMIYCNDDNIELDGGQQNVRCFRNRFEGALCGVSIQGCMVSPVYVYDNDFCGMDDEMQHPGQQIKTSGFDLFKVSPVAYVFGNEFSGAGTFSTNAIRPRGLEYANVYRDPALPPVSRPEYPVRPLPFLLDVTRLAGVEVRRGVAAPAAQHVKATWTGPKDGKPVRFSVRKNDVFDWFDVTPSEGTIGPGQTVDFTVSYDASKMNDRRIYRGAFLVRTPEGLSRVCSITAATDFVPPFKAERPGRRAFYVDAFAPVSGTPKVVDDPRGRSGKAVKIVSKKRNGTLEYAFDIPSDGRYYLFVRGASSEPSDVLDARAPWPRLAVSVDGEKAEPSTQQARRHMTWTMLTPGCTQGEMIRSWQWKAGRHTVTLQGVKGELYIDGLVATDDPLSFEPR